MKNNPFVRFVLPTLCAGILLLLFLFSAMWDDKNLMSSGDHSYANLELLHAMGLKYYAALWLNVNWLGLYGGIITPGMSTVMADLISPRWSYWLIPMGSILVLLMASLAFLRSLGVSRFTAAAIALLMAFAPVHFSFINAGHMAKLWSIAFYPLILFFTHRAATGKGRLWDHLLAGLFLGVAFMNGETPTTLYFAVLITAYYAFQVLAGTEGKGMARVKAALKPLAFFLLIPVATLPFSFDTFLSQYYHVAVSKPTGDPVPTAASRQGAQSAQGYEWATQWSFPIEETPELFIAGLYGWKSGDAEYPYWGRTGQTPGWTPGSQGLMNLSQTTAHLGFALCFFALFAVVAVRRREVWFWLAIFLVALSLAWGRHFFTYFGIYHLPLIDKFRNPNRFLHLVHFSVAILAAYGFEHAWCLAKERLSFPAAKAWNRTGFILGGLTLVAMLAVLIFQAEITSHVSERVGGNFGDKAPGFILGSLGVFLLLLVLFQGGLRLAFWKRTDARVAGVLLVLLVGVGLVDVARVDARYVVAEPTRQLYQMDDLNKFLVERQKATLGRIKYLTRGPYLHFHLTHLLWNHQLESVDIPAASRIPEDLETYLTRLKPESLKYFRLQGVRHYLSDEPYDVFGLQPSETFQDPFQRGKPIYYYEDTNGLPRAWMVHTVVAETNLDRIFQTLNHPAFDPAKIALLTRTDIPELALPTVAPAQAGRVTFEKRTFTDIVLRTESEAPGFLVLSDWYHGDWVTRIDGKPVPMRRADYLLRGVFVPAGSHSVQFTLPAPAASRYIGAASWLALLAALGAWAFARRREKKSAMQK